MRYAVGASLSAAEKSPGVNEGVLLSGYRQDMREVLWTLEPFAFHSKREGLGSAAIEAMVADLPLVVSGVGGMKDYLRNAFCRNCPSQTPDAYAEAITGLAREFITFACDR